jgi:glucose/arabinose dehydrogenase
MSPPIQRPIVRCCTPATLLRLSCACLFALALSGCYNLRPSSGGGEARFTPPRQVEPADIALPGGYRIEAIVSGLTFPTGVAIDERGRPHVVEAGYSYGELFTQPRLLRVELDGRTSVVAAGGKNGPWNGLVYHDGAFYIAEGGQIEGGRILRVGQDGSVETLVENLPGQGDHHTNGPAIGPDGALYIGQGTATNSGVVGEDSAKFGWLARHPRFHDTPCRDVELAGINFQTQDVVAKAGSAITGAFLPFGTPSSPGQRISGATPCNGAILRLVPGGALEVFAWGFRNPFGLAFSPDGELYVTENGYDDRGSRPVWGTPDVLWRVQQGGWYGWPDFAAAKPLTDPAFRPPRDPQPAFLLARHPGTPPRPAALLGVHSSSNGFDFSRSDAFGHAGQAFIAQFGDQAPETGKVLGAVGFKVVRVDPRTGVVHDFAVNRGRNNGPASKIGGGGLERPVAARFDPAGDALYVVDFGVLLQQGKGTVPQPGTGVLWRITRGDSP